MTRGTILGLAAVSAAFLFAAVGLLRVSDWLAGDWRKVRECSATYWTCEAIVAGEPREGAGGPVPFSRLARSCSEYDAWETAIRRATFDCTMERGVAGPTCKLAEAACALPERHR